MARPRGFQYTPRPKHLARGTSFADRLADNKGLPYNPNKELWVVAMGMVKPAEVTGIVRQGKFEVGIMIYTATMVLATDFLEGVLTAMILYIILKRLGFGKVPQTATTSERSETPAEVEMQPAAG